MKIEIELENKGKNPQKVAPTNNNHRISYLSSRMHHSRLRIIPIIQLLQPLQPQIIPPHIRIKPLKKDPSIHEQLFLVVDHRPEDPRVQPHVQIFLIGQMDSRPVELVRFLDLMVQNAVGLSEDLPAHQFELFSVPLVEVAPGGLCVGG